MTFDMTWEKIFKERPWGKYPSEDVIRFVARNFYKILPRHQIKILDLGCGGGAQTWYMAREGFDVYAIDGSASAIEQTKSLLKTDNLTAHLQIGDVATLNYENNFFDAVIDCNTIQHNSWQDILNIHAEIKRVLKKNGCFFSMSLTSDTTGWKVAEKIDQNTYKGFQNSFITSGVIAHLFTSDEIDFLMKDYTEIEITRLSRYKESDCISHVTVSAKMNKSF